MPNYPYTYRYPKQCNKSATCTCPTCEASWRQKCATCGKEVHPSKINLSGECDDCFKFHYTVVVHHRRQMRAIERSGGFIE